METTSGLKQIQARACKHEERFQVWQHSYRVYKDYLAVFYQRQVQFKERIRRYQEQEQSLRHQWEDLARFRRELAYRQVTYYERSPPPGRDCRLTHPFLTKSMQSPASRSNHILALDHFWRELNPLFPLKNDRSISCKAAPIRFEAFVTQDVEKQKHAHDGLTSSRLDKHPGSCSK